MEAWRQCARWLVAARVLPAAHRASGPEGHVWDLAQALRDGVLLCHLLNALLPRAVSPHDICPRPQMSQVQPQGHFGFNLATFWVDLGGFWVFFAHRFLLYGRYCSQVESAARRLDQLATNTDLRMKLRECSQRANNGRFSLRDLLMVPMQRVLKYHLLLQVSGGEEPRRPGAAEPRSPQWSHTFLLIATAGLQGYELFFKTHELKKKWLEQFEMALSNIFPEHALADGHEFQMFSFEDTTSCRACQMLLRWDPQNYGPFWGGQGDMEKGILGVEVKVGQWLGGVKSWVGGTFYQGYRCSRCRAPRAQGVSGQDGALWEGRGWFAGPMERGEAEEALAPRSDGAFLVRQRVKDGGEYAISIKFRGEVKHIKVMTGEGLFRVTDKKAFKGLVELVEFYQRHSLRDCFKALDTTLAVAFKEPERRAGPWAHGAVRSFGSAKARYDFSARDRTELTLREGDVIRVLSKKGHPGWWKGEIYGRVGPPHVAPELQHLLP
ncbi:hypothetical protein Q9233_016266, partial [Columba guinea]